MKTIAILITAICLTLFACSYTAAAKPVPPGAAMVKPGKQPHQESEKIELNHGKKWKVDKNMLLYIRHMEQDVASFSNTGQRDYKDLSDKLKTNVNLLTSNCTMKGKAHDELHKWLLPYISLVNQLSKSKNEAEAGEHFREIQSSLNMFNQYFQ